MAYHMFLQYMEDGATGERGKNVVKLVVKVFKPGSDNVITHHPSMVVTTVKETQLSKRHATRNYVQVRKILNSSST